ncbi:basic amino acid/polyamine antiporter [Cellulomonas hominis]|uniref:basic amino acid/polyamine antiporter n=1 Tax=Cellulomonas hominis TaxID=156981 RepID=UPI001BA2DDCF|nr:basic amino acid/polyamine antiporter [Cellulomonas hominis]VTR75414.1 Arginine/ornithine antiporter [Cellulomonas hominis]
MPDDRGQDPVSGTATTGAEAPPAARLGRWTLTALVVGSMVGAGVFSLPGEFAQRTGVLGTVVAWVVAGSGTLALALTFLRLADRRPDLDAGVYAYARAGFGRYAGFLSAAGYFLSAVVGNVAFWVLITSTVGAWVPAFEDGATPAAVAVASAGVWVYHLLILRGVQSATAINRVVTVAKLVPLAVFVVVAATAFDPAVWVANLGTGDASLLAHVRSTMLITVFVFIGIEGASVYSRFARRRRDVGAATVTGFVGVLALFVLVTLLPYGVLPVAEIAALDQPSVGGVLAHVLGPAGAAFVGAGLVVSVLGAYLAWTLMSCEVVVQAARDGDMPAWLGRENARGAPVAAVTATSVLVQLFLLTVLGTTDAFTVAVELCSSLVLVPYLLSAGYSLRVAVADRGAPHRRGWVLLAVVTVVYAVFLVWAGGLGYLLLTCLVYAPASVLHLRVRRAGGGLRPAERIACVLVTVLAVVAVVGLVTGRIEV